MKTSPRVRSAALRLTLALLGGCVAGATPGDEAAAKWTLNTAHFLETLSRDDNGFAFPDQAQSHLTTTFAALGVRQTLGIKTADPSAVAAYVRNAHPQYWRKPPARQHQFELQQIQSLLWLGQDPGEPFTQEANAWTKPKPYSVTFESHGYPAFGQQMACLVARQLLKLPNDDLQEFVAYVESRRRENGSYNNNPPADDGSDGHVINTLWALEGLKALHRPVPEAAGLVKWLQSCQRTQGHFAYAPRPPLAPNANDVVYTWAAVQALKMLDAKPADVDGCVRYLHSLYSADGGFGDRPGWPSNSIATYYAVDALAALDALSQPIPSPAARAEAAPLPDGLKVFTIQIEAPGVGSPSEAVDMARAMRIDLWGGKSASPAWTRQAQKIADAQGIPLTFFVANEEYGTFFDIPGMGTYSHLADVLAPAGVDFGKSMAGVTPRPTYAQFLRDRIAPLEAAGGRNVYQFNENEGVERMLLDASLEAPGFAAISSFHFNNPDFITSAPSLWHYQHRIPILALQDNHAQQPWHWGDQLAGFRTLFLAKEPTWAGWLEAVKANRVVAVRHDGVSGNKLWVHGGDPATRAFVERERRAWQWWQDLPTDSPPTNGRPMVSLVALTAADPMEPGAPKAGTALRIRRRWSNTSNGTLDKATAELVSVTVDGRAVQPERVVVERGARPAVGEAVRPDEYFLVPVSNFPPGEHTATATVKPLGDTPATNALSVTVRFDIEK